jgi:hypothetical protein
MNQTAIGINAPTTFRMLIKELNKAYQEAKATKPFGKLIGMRIRDEELFHLAPRIALKYRNIKNEIKIEQAIEAALSSYLANKDNFPEILKYPEISFTLCYLAAHFRMGIYTAEIVDKYMIRIEEDIAKYRREIDNTEA